MNRVSSAAVVDSKILASLSPDVVAHLITRQATSPRGGRYLIAFFLLCGLLLGSGIYTWIKVQEAEARQTTLDARISQLDREISSRIYQWIAIAQDLPPAANYARSSAALSLYGLLLSHPASTGGLGLQAKLPGFANRGLISLILELAELQQDPAAHRQVARVGSLIMQTEALFGDCASPRECSGTVAMNILLDRWRQ